MVKEFEAAQKAMENKRKFNEISKEILKYDKKAVFDLKLKTIEDQLKDLEETHSKHMKNY